MTEKVLDLGIFNLGEVKYDDNETSQQELALHLALNGLTVYYEGSRLELRKTALDENGELETIKTSFNF